MDHLFEQVRHSQSVVILADPRGMLMHTLGDAYFLERAERVALMCGASWHEEQRGTNAIGTALAERQPVEIHGAENFLERNGFLTCAAAPIRLRAVICWACWIFRATSAVAIHTRWGWSIRRPG